MGKIHFSDFILLEEEINVDFVKKVLDSLYPKLVDQLLDTEDIENVLDQGFKPYNIQFEEEYFGEKARDKKLKKYYISRADIDENGTITIYYNNTIHKVFDNDLGDFTPRKYKNYWNGFVEVIKSLVAHELTHRNQIEQIKKAVKDPQKFYNIIDRIIVDPEVDVVLYLSKIPELAAMASQSIQEFKSKGYSNQQILNRVKRPFDKNIKKPKIKDSFIFRTYVEYTDPGNKVLKRFLQYMVKGLK